MTSFAVLEICLLLAMTFSPPAAALPLCARSVSSVPDCYAARAVDIPPSKMHDLFSNREPHIRILKLVPGLEHRSGWPELVLGNFTFDLA